jgi:GrpB-like predicted nucleotidyltransferase (UPF0157 family)
MAVYPADSAVATYVEQPIRIVAHDPGWAAVFERERTALEAAIGAWATGGIHHVGSTAIPAVDAEPVVDILVGTAGPPPADCVDALLELDYAFVGGGEGVAWCKPPGASRLYDLHLIPVGATRYEEMLAFRDLLCADLQIAIGFTGLKRELARRHAGDRRAYAAAKGELVRAALARAAAASGN